MLTRAQIEGAIQNYREPDLGKTLFELNAIKDITLNDSNVHVDIELGYPADSIKRGMIESLQASIEALADVNRATINVASKIKAHKAQSNIAAMDNVKNIIAIASGKGGVGKSTTTANLALALVKEGARVGILDADIYGPSQPLMLGVPEGQRPETREQKYFIPIEAHGLQTMSMGYLVDENTPMVWRGPMVSGALKQMLNSTLWDNLDYLLIDMPPGTGDIQLTLSQAVPVTGSVVVTTPQDIALLDAKKGIEMFRKVNIPVLGVVENMSLHTCSQCGHSEHIFGEGGGDRIAKDYDTTLLGSLPLTLKIREQSDSGTPTVLAAPDSEETALYSQIARRLAATLSAQEANTAIPNIVMMDD